ncbi:TerB family tellurite resistance protein [Thalassotalea ponticola]|uniref:tellurite resistance TerB family protein n=1 Tax=Thalassotalea ponticola TaxID=1523392 RepID=UPI0025B48CB9|nr:TerB family tellurite resistance protein [Thalassotalea ponticola]MDN3653372.1 TerB family tellurite resistance protein [Thalassotalea ponticola]
MINRIRVFFKALQTDSMVGNTLSLEIATAVLLFEVMRADQTICDKEQAKVVALLQQTFSLDKQEVLEVLALAEDEVAHAHDLYKYTSLINSQFSLSQRIQIVESLWHLAYSDGQLDVIEEHVIRRIADLLHLRHGEFIECKLKVQNQQGIES